MAIENDLLKRITKIYLTSRDFNGTNIDNLQEEFGLQRTEIMDNLISLIKSDKIVLNFGDKHINPFIKAFQDDEISVQLEKLSQPQKNLICAYPSKSYLKSIVNQSDYQDRPFTLKLVLGEPQLSFDSFDLSILEFYRNDPRYYYRTDGITGWISVKDHFYNSDQMPKSDKVILESFGFSYNESMTRAVAVFLIYLSRLSPQHQQIWNAKILEGSYKLHPIYERECAGMDPEYISIFTAFTMELSIINQMSLKIWQKSLFRQDFSDEHPPANFTFLTRPTLKEFCDFIHTLDKMLSDNIKKEFFKGKIQLDEEIPRKDGKIEIRQIGTIRLLEMWLIKFFRIPDRTPVIEMIKTLKKIREFRQRPAHALDDDRFDQKFFHRQRELIIEAYDAVRTIRLIFSNHPKAREIEIPEWIYLDKIVTY